MKTKKPTNDVTRIPFKIDEDIVLERDGQRLPPQPDTLYNIAYITHAVNCHEELMEALKSIHVDCVSCEKSRLPCPYAQAIAKCK